MYYAHEKEFQRYCETHYPSQKEEDAEKMLNRLKEMEEKLFIRYWRVKEIVRKTEKLYTKYKHLNSRLEMYYDREDFLRKKLREVRNEWYHFIYEMNGEVSYEMQNQLNSI